MNTIDNTTYAGVSSRSAAAAASSGSAAASGRTTSLGQADFLKLMTEQLKNQDPLKPMDNSQFLGQLAQFSTVQGITDLNSNFENLSSTLTNNQLVQGAELVGRQALVPSTSLVVDKAGGTASGTVIAPAAGTIAVNISNAGGTVVRTLNLAASSKQEVPFQWDGLDNSGQPVAAGQYTLTATHLDGAGKSTALDTYANAAIDSVSVGKDGLYLNLANLGSIALDNVIRIGGSKS